MQQKDESASNRVGLARLQEIRGRERQRASVSVDERKRAGENDVQVETRAINQIASAHLRGLEPKNHWHAIECPMTSMLHSDE